MDTTARPKSHAVRQRLALALLVCRQVGGCTIRGRATTHRHVIHAACRATAAPSLSPQHSGPPRVHIPHTTHCPSRLSSQLGLTGQRLGSVAGGGCRVG